jgi:hypothetical protein
MIASKIGELISYIPAKSVGKQVEKFLMAALIKVSSILYRESSEVGESCPDVE